MANPFYLLLGLLLASSYPTGAEPLRFARPDQAGAVLAAIAAALVLQGILAWGVNRWLVVRQLRGSAAWARALLRIAALLLYGFMVYSLHLPLWVWRMGFEGNALLGGLLILAPLMGLLGVGAIMAARAERLLRGGGTTASGYLGFAFRSFLGLALLPVILVLSLELCFQKSAVLSRLAILYPFTAWIALMAGVTFLMFLLPPILRFTFQARPLPPGPARERLEGLCRRLGFRYGELLGFRTSGLALANAFIVGLWPGWRNVFFTDALIAGMKLEQLECVLAHEIAHAQRRHILFYLLFSLGFILVGALAADLLDQARVPALLGASAMLALVVLVWFGLFGYISRRFESEADLAAARVAGGARPGEPARYAAARPMAATLGALARLNGIPVSAWSWRHFSLMTRMQILLAAEADPRIGFSLERRCEGLRSAGLTLLLLGAGCGVYLGARQASRVEAASAKWEAYERVQRGIDLERADRFAEAATEIRAGIEAGVDEADAARFSLWLARCERQAGRIREAEEAESRARRGPLVDPRDRLLLPP